MSKKIGCVVQGDIRRGTKLVLMELCRHFDEVILSTWDDEKYIPEGPFDVIISKKPENPGYVHRNYQRRTTSEGLKRAAYLNCAYVLKWRTDMLPTSLDVKRLFEMANFNVQPGVDARIVTCAYRNVSVDIDYFSSIPDLFAFSSLKMMQLLWDDKDFDYSKEVNFPREMVENCDPKLLDDYLRIYYAETELYCILKLRLEKYFNRKLTHEEILKQYFYIFNHKIMKICWFNNNGGFRSVFQAWSWPWWSERTWKKSRPLISDPYYHHTYKWRLFREWMTPKIVNMNIKRQEHWYKLYLDKYGVLARE